MGCNLCVGSNAKEEMHSMLGAIPDCFIFLGLFESLSGRRVQVRGAAELCAATGSLVASIGPALNSVLDPAS